MDKWDIIDINKRKEYCIHDPIHSEIDPKDKTEVVGMETDSIIYIHFSQFVLLSHSPNMTWRNGH